MTDTERPEPSPEFTITMGVGVSDVVRACLGRVENTMRDVHTAESYEDLAHKREAVIEQMWSLLRNLGYSFLIGNTHDGNLHLSPDGPRSIFFRFDSGYHGAMICHDNADNPSKASWSTHT